jgi:predicted HD phosphohydrolase
MTPNEATRFEQHPYFTEILQLRYWDEQAKVPGLPTRDMAYYLTMMA